MTVSVTFLGAAGTVTGSKYLVQSGNKSILVDCGVFQGPREWREKNWKDPDFKLENVDAVLFTHAHIDHSGLFPRYHTLGLDCPAFCTEATLDLLKILLPDMGYLQEQEAEYRKRKKKSRHIPPLPLFTQKDAQKSLNLLSAVSYDTEIDIAPGVTAKWRHMGHILGAASIELKIDGKKIVFSGDIGRYSIPILLDPKPVDFGDLLLIESTYGDREHKDYDVSTKLATIINETTKRKGAVVIPSFAVGRAQLLLYFIRELKEKNLIPDIPVILDSPMATDATEIYKKHVQEYDKNALDILHAGNNPFSTSKLALIKDVAASKKLNNVHEPMILISASGMLMGGRILHHLYHRIDSERNTVLFVGYQPKGGRGDWIQSGAEKLRLFGDEIPIKAQIETLSGLSAHADKSELLRWTKECSGNPGKVAVVHGEKDSAESFAKTLKKENNWDTFMPKYLERYEI